MIGFARFSHIRTRALATRKSPNYLQSIELVKKMKLEATTEVIPKDEVIMRSVHGDEVRMPYSFFERLRQFHNANLPVIPLHEKQPQSKEK